MRGEVGAPKSSIGSLATCRQRVGRRKSTKTRISKGARSWILRERTVRIVSSRPVETLKVLGTKDLEALEITPEIPRTSSSAVPFFHVIIVVFPGCIGPSPLLPLFLAFGLFLGRCGFFRSFPLRPPVRRLCDGRILGSVGRGIGSGRRPLWPVLRKPRLCERDEGNLRVVRCYLCVHVVSHEPVELSKDDESLVVDMSTDLKENLAGQSRKSPD